MSSPRLPLSSRPTFLPDEISRREFATVFRGYDPAEVRTFLNQLSEQSVEMSDRIAEVQKALVEMQERVKNPELDEEMVTKLLGEQTAQILRSAREAANDIRGKAESEVSISLREAHEVTTKMRNDGEALLAERTAEAERVSDEIRTDAATAAATTRREAAEEASTIRAQVAAEIEASREQTEAELAELRERTHAEAAEEIANARLKAMEMIEAARAESAALVERTTEAQAEMVEGLVRKRKIALAQVEELRAGRQRLLKAYKMVRGTLDEVTAELERVEEEARQAAELAGTRSAQSNDISAEDLDTVIEIETYSMTDDVSPEVIDLLKETDYQPEARPNDVQGSNDDRSDDDENQGGTDFGGGGGGGEGAGRQPTAAAGNDYVDLDAPQLYDQSADHTESIDMTPTSEPSAPRQSGGPVAMLERQEEMTVIDLERPVNEDDDDEIQVMPEVRTAPTSFIIGESAAAAPGEFDKNLEVRREMAINKSRTQAARRLRRTLQDEQESLVAKMRNGDGESVQALFGSAEDQAATYQRAVVKLFREVVRTGTTSVEGSTGVEKGTVERAGTTAARGLADELVNDLRSQLTPIVEELLANRDVIDPNSLQHLLAGPFRALRGDYLDALVDDRIGGAFDQGAAFARQ